MVFERHPDHETRARTRRVAQLLLTLDLRMALDAARELDGVYPVALLRRKRAWAVRAEHDDEPWNELARTLGWHEQYKRDGSNRMPSSDTLKLAREALDAQCQILFQMEHEHA